VKTVLAETADPNSNRMALPRNVSTHYISRNYLGCKEISVRNKPFQGIIQIGFAGGVSVLMC